MKGKPPQHGGLIPQFVPQMKKKKNKKERKKAIEALWMIPGGLEGSERYSSTYQVEMVVGILQVHLRDVDIEELVNLLVPGATIQELDFLMKSRSNLDADQV